MKTNEEIEEKSLFESFMNFHFLHVSKCTAKEEKSFIIEAVTVLR